MAELTVPTSGRRGSPFAAELDRKLAGTAPLINAVAWWRAGYQEWRESQPPASAGGPSIKDLTENEEAVFYLGLTWSISPVDGVELSEEVDDPDVQKCWDRVKQARAALRANLAAQTGEQLPQA
jgi:hypothetical protein